MGLGKTIINVGPQGVKRYLPLVHHLAPGNLVVGVACQARIIDAPDLGMGFQVLGPRKNQRRRSFGLPGTELKRASWLGVTAELPSTSTQNQK